MLIQENTVPSVLQIARRAAETKHSLEQVAQAYTEIVASLYSWVLHTQ
jgi:hypothetical protein